MAFVTRTRIAGMLAITLLLLSAPGALAGAEPLGTDVWIRNGSGPWVGNGIYGEPQFGQEVSNSGVTDQKLTFFIAIESDNDVSPFSYKVKRSGSFNDGYRVRYYDALNNDVTGKVNAGTFTTPLVQPNEQYVMRATVKIRPFATACTNVTRFITASSTANLDAKDTVRFSASLAPNCPPVANDDADSITEGSFEQLHGNVLPNDTDPDGDPFVNVILLTPPAYTTLFGFTAGHYDYDLDDFDPAVAGLNDHDMLTDSFTYSISDGHGGTDTATVTITIHGHTNP